MNQILVLENKAKKNKKNKFKKRGGGSGQIEIKNIVAFFAVSIMMFAFVMIGHSSYAIYRESKGRNTNDIPTISIARENDVLLVSVESTYVIDKFKYSWQNSQQTSVPEETTSFEEEIILPSTNNVLTIVLEDETGRATTYIKEIVLDGIDIVKPTIDIEQGQGLSAIITATDETKIEYITYRLDEGEEIRIDKNHEEDTVIKYAVTEIPRGEHTLYVTAVDSFGNTETVEQTIIVSTDVPTIHSIDVDKEIGKILIHASDVDGLKSIEVNINGQVYSMDDINLKEATFAVNIRQGTNTLSIKLTNVNGLSAEGATEFEYAE